MTISFGLLGPVTLRVDDTPAVLPTGRPQLLLAALLLGRGRRISVDRLLHDLWDVPPPSAAANLRTHVTRLRAALGPYRTRLTWVNSGYALAVDPGELDLDGFDQAVRDAAEAARRGQPAHAADRLASALGRWRGEAAEGLPRHGALGSILHALDESRWGAVERYAALAVDAGRHQEAVAALRGLLAERPTRASAWSALVRALTHQGDQVEAAAAAAAAEAALRGFVTRGPVVTGGGRHDVVRPREQLYRTPEPVPAGPRPLPAAIGESTPRTARSAPPPPVALIGREKLLARVEEELARSRMVVLHGPAGVGKSALAGVVANRLAHTCPGGQVYLDLYGSSPGLAPMTADEAIGCLLRALGGDRCGGTPGAEAAELRLRVSDQRVLVVLDNVVGAGQVRRLTSVLGNALVIVTSRTTLPTLDVTHIPVGELTPDEAVTLLARYAGPDRFDRHPTEAEALAALCGHLPLALRIVGARLSGHPEWTLADMVARLADEQYRLDELSCDDLAVRASLAVTCDVLADRAGGPEALALFDRWGMVGAPSLGLDLARVLTGATARTARVLLDRLADAGLIEPCGADRYRLHDLVRIYAMERGRRDVAARAATVHAYRCHLLATARRARDLIRPYPDRCADGFVEEPAMVTFTDQRQALRWLDRERENLVAAARAAAGEDTGDGDVFAVRLCAELYPFLPMRGYYRQLREVAEGALRCARRRGSRPEEAMALTYVAVARSRLGETDQAVENLRVALALLQADDDTRAVAVTLDHLGVLLAAAGRLDEAREASLRALAMHRDSGDRRRMGITLNNLADVLLQLGQHDDALVRLRESLRLRQELGDELGIGVTTVTIGQVHARNGRYRAAYRWLDRALTAARATGNREAEWRALTVRAGVHRARGRGVAARDDLRLALAISEEIGDVIGIREVCRALAELDD